MMLSRDQILSASDLKHEDVEVPEWGGTVRVRALTAGERDKWEALTYLDKKGVVAKSPEDIRAKLIAFSCVDEEGKRLFTEEDIAALSAKSGAAMNRLWAVASRLSIVLASDVEELTKNSDSAQRDAS